MAGKKSGKSVKRPVRKAGKSGSRSRLLVILAVAAVLAAALYAAMSHWGIFNPVTGKSASSAVGHAGSQGKAGKAGSASREAGTEPAGKAGAPVAKAEPKPVEAPKPVVPPAPVCSGQPLTLDDVQKKVADPSWTFVDVRPAEKFAVSNIKGAHSIPANDFDAAFAREGASLAQSSGIIIYGEDFNDKGVLDVCAKMAGKGLPKIYLFRDGMSRPPVNPAQ